MLYMYVRFYCIPISIYGGDMFEDIIGVRCDEIFISEGYSSSLKP